MEALKPIELERLEQINGGDAVEFIDGACSVIGAAGAIGYFASMLNPFTAAVTGFCVGWSIGRSLPM